MKRTYKIFTAAAAGILASAIYVWPDNAHHPAALTSSAKSQREADGLFPFLKNSKDAIDQTSEKNAWLNVVKGGEPQASPFVVLGENNILTAKANYLDFRVRKESDPREAYKSLARAFESLNYNVQNAGLIGLSPKEMVSILNRYGDQEILALYWQYTSGNDSDPYSRAELIRQMQQAADLAGMDINGVLHPDAPYERLSIKTSLAELEKAQADLYLQATIMTRQEINANEFDAKDRRRKIEVLDRLIDAYARATMSLKDNPNRNISRETGMDEKEFTAIYNKREALRPNP